MPYTITSNSPLDIRLGEKDKVYSILQDIALLLSTKKGSIPMYRDFGIPMEWIGRPLAVAETLVYQEVSDALEAFESRVSLLGVKLIKSQSDFGKMDIQVEVDIL